MIISKWNWIGAGFDFCKEQGNLCGDYGLCFKEAQVVFDEPEDA